MLYCTFCRPLQALIQSRLVTDMLGAAWGRLATFLLMHGSTVSPTTSWRKCWASHQDKTRREITSVPASLAE